MKKSNVYYASGMTIIAVVVCVFFYQQLWESTLTKEKTIKVGIVFYRQDDEFIASMQQAMEEEISEIIKEHPQAKLDFQLFDSKNSQSYQNDIVESLIKNQYDVLCINLVDRTAASVTIDRAKAANIPVIFFNREPVEADLTRWDHVYYVGSDPERAGIMQGNLILSFNQKHTKILDKNQDGKIQYCLIEGEALHQDAILRTKFALQTISDKLELENVSREIADWSYTTSFHKIKQLIKSQPTIELIISNNDAMALGARDALLESNIAERELPYIVGIDGLVRSLKLSSETVLFDTIINDSQTQAIKILSLACDEIFSKKKNTEDSRYFMIPYKTTEKNSEFL
ncbi:galactose ABC transporter substrate-binding protein [Vagococcus zengguangii]|uniref:galactose ABC transporter substrate-binding protein n=1 Tax=Vagococcus zengguangii TaxID=2571750 RepID=UPI0011092081|nr:galactose ABC transporter substrate-binding protein [Vagococcus zengguangii]TLG81386.1 substrate-binding domain-containing protein [Vagococcus zengguangii]